MSILSSQKTDTGARPRNHGLDLLRMVCMLMVAVLHVLGQGGVMVRAGNNAPTYFTCYFLETACLCAVNCYGLLSGYVGIRSRFNARRLVGMILTVEMYSLLIGLILGIPNRDWLDRGTLLQIILPIQWKTWWYYSAYVGLYLLMPFLNRGVKGFSRKEKENLLTVSFVLFGVLTMFSKTFYMDFLSLVGGYSLIWLIILYVFGASLRELEDERKSQSMVMAEEKKQARKAGPSIAQNGAYLKKDLSGTSNETSGESLESQPGEGQERALGFGGIWDRILGLGIPTLLVIFLGSTALAWAWKLLVDTHVIIAPEDTQLQRMLLIYHSPTIFVNGIALLLLFRQLKISAGWLRRLIAILAPSAFYVYIIHTHPLIWEHILKGAFSKWKALSPLLVIPVVLGTALLIYLACSGIDLIRRQLTALARGVKKADA